MVIERGVRYADGVGPAAEFARCIRHCGSASITFNGPGFGKHEPDASFQHRDALYPCVVLEVSYAQKRKDIVSLAEDYILGSEGNIGKVIGIDVDYKAKSATISIWEPRVQAGRNGDEELVADQILSNQEFRTVKGDAKSGGGLRIRLEDFAPAALSKHHTFDNDIFISSTDLCTYLHDAEQHASNIKGRIGYTDLLRPGVKRRRRSSTPPEEVTTDDESRFQEEEKRAVKRAQHSDADYDDAV